VATTLTINNLTKKFGRITAVNKLSLKIETGQIFGILGPNGSGKTTTLGMILDVVAPTSGKFNWFENTPNEEARKKIGSILESPCFYPYLTPVQNLRITAHIKNCDPKRIDDVLKQVNLYDRRNDKFKTFSLGMKQRLSIAAALLSDPPVLILDEPTNGLDPEGIAEVRELITKVAQQGKTIIMASHLLDEVQKVCTHFCVLRKGDKIHEGSVKDTLEELNKVEVAADYDETEMQNILYDFEGTEEIKKTDHSFLVTLKPGFTASEINKHCFDNGVNIRRLLTQTNTLEKEFLKILKEHD
jgi:ABC-2 type transport system ATP-binding protein